MYTCIYIFMIYIYIYDIYIYIYTNNAHNDAISKGPAAPAATPSGSRSPTAA